MQKIPTSSYYCASSLYELIHLDDSYTLREVMYITTFGRNELVVYSDRFVGEKYNNYPKREGKKTRDKTELLAIIIALHRRVSMRKYIL